MKGKDMVIIGAYSPNDNASDQEKTMFYNQLTTLLEFRQFLGWIARKAKNSVNLSNLYFVEFGKIFRDVKSFSHYTRDITQPFYCQPI